MESFCHWLTELDEVYARHVSRHGPNRLLPAEVLPVHERVPEHSGPSPQGAGSDESIAEHSMHDLPARGFCGSCHPARSHN
jgi:hypothetical protein